MIDGYFVELYDYISGIHEIKYVDRYDQQNFK